MCHYKNNLGKRSCRKPSLDQPSSQKLNIALSPNAQAKFIWNQLGSTPSSDKASAPFHHWDCPCTCRSTEGTLRLLYLASNTFTHSKSFSHNTLHHHLPIRALLYCSIFHTSRPPWSFLKQTKSHFIQAINLLLQPFPTRSCTGACQFVVQPIWESYKKIRRTMK